MPAGLPPAAIATRHSDPLPLQPPAPTVNLLLNITQPLMKQTGQLRWALNNVAGQVTPPCTALLDLVYE